MTKVSMLSDAEICRRADIIWKTSWADSPLSLASLCDRAGIHIPDVLDAGARRIFGISRRQQIDERARKHDPLSCANGIHIAVNDGDGYWHCPACETGHYRAAPHLTRWQRFWRWLGDRLLPHCLLLGAILGLTVGLCAEEAIPAVYRPSPDRDSVPAWCLHGIAAIESSSRYVDGHLIYVDRRRGQAGEAGPFQITAAAFAIVRAPGERFAQIASDIHFAETATRRYLRFLYDHTGDWDAAVAAYHVGLHGSLRLGRGYAARARAVGQ